MVRTLHCQTIDALTCMSFLSFCLMFRGSNEVNLLKKDCLGIFLSKSPLSFRATKVCQSRINRHAVLIFLLHNVMSLELCQISYCPDTQSLFFLLDNVMSLELCQISYCPDTHAVLIFFLLDNVMSLELRLTSCCSDIQSSSFY